MDSHSEISRPLHVFAVRCVPGTQESVAWINTEVLAVQGLDTKGFDASVFSTIKLRFQDRTISMDVRLGALRLYRKHLVDQYSDRCAFWALKDVSCEAMSKTVTLSTDGADQD